MTQSIQDIVTAARKLQACVVCLSWQGTLLRSLCCWQVCGLPSFSARNNVSMSITIPPAGLTISNAACGMQAQVQTGTSL